MVWLAQNELVHSHSREAAHKGGYQRCLVVLRCPDVLEADRTQPCAYNMGDLTHLKLNLNHIIWDQTLYNL